MNPDFKELLQLFNANHVEYLIIGGYAVIEYTEPRYTKDLDIWIHAEQGNAERVFASLIPKTIRYNVPTNRGGS